MSLTKADFDTLMDMNHHTFAAEYPKDLDHILWILANAGRATLDTWRDRDAIIKALTMIIEAGFQGQLRDCNRIKCAYCNKELRSEHDNGCEDCKCDWNCLDALGVGLDMLPEGGDIRDVICPDNHRCECGCVSCDGAHGDCDCADFGRNEELCERKAGMLMRERMDMALRRDKHMSLKQFVDQTNAEFKDQDAYLARRW